METIDSTKADFPAPDGPETMIRLPFAGILLDVLNLLSQLFDFRLDRNARPRDF